MEIVKVLPLDLKGELASNYISDEVQPVTALSRDWYRPDYSPFFIDDFELYDGDGMLLKRNVHYSFESLNQEMVKKTGKPVYNFFRIKDITLNYKKSYHIKYRSIGNTGFPRSLISKMAHELLNSDYWVDWDTQVLGKPPTMPAYQHWHDIATEVANWDQFISFAQQHLDFVMETKRAHYDRTMAMINKVEGLFSKEHRDYRQRLKEHDQDYGNPHELERKHFSLTYIPNVPLATVKEDYQGDIIDRFSTPKGLALAVKDKQRMSPTLVRSGEIKQNAFNLLGKTSTVHPPRTMEFNQITKAAVCRDVKDGLVFYFGDNSGQPIGLLYGQGTELSFTGEQRDINASDGRSDEVLKTLGGGVVIRRHDSNTGLYYANPEELLSGSPNFTKLDLSNLDGLYGTGWEERSWFVKCQRGLLLITHDTESSTYVYNVKFSLFEFDDAQLDLGKTYTSRALSFDYQNEDGTDIKDSYRLALVSIKQGTETNTFDRFHHSFTRAIRTVNLNGHGFSLSAEVENEHPERVLLKLLTSVTLDGDEYPIESGWELNLKEMRFTNIPGSSNARSIDNTKSYQRFGDSLIKLTKGPSKYPSLGISQDGNLINYYGNKRYTACGTISMTPMLVYRTSVETKLFEGVVSKDANLGLVVVPSGETKWTVSVPNDCEAVYQGVRATLKRCSLDVRTSSKWSGGGVTPIQVGLISSPSGLMLVTDEPEHKGFYPIARMLIDDTGISNFSLMTGD
ncbi:minor tail protein [Vibrio phage Aphrodite1]|uniref:Minor tail protein n=1 Tax=Vibrio phage Aphrodite1 TaxID=2070057 RepID=A0A2I7QHQ9_9CAUD|nr:minor tail protein [Vibrio phage Aphrodite1]AUR80922.1 minor tail protein [Vibrio phage Aphrodite1]